MPTAFTSCSPIDSAWSSSPSCKAVLDAICVQFFLYLTVKGAGFPSVDEGVLMLLGISGATYALGKTLEKPAAPTPDKG
ncbi:MAG TPA: hypothetical protein VGI10_14135 [Polyangiaceae bacterium]